MDSTEPGEPAVAWGGVTEHVLPEGVELVRTTPEFTEHTVPAGLRANHHVAPGVWGRLVVLAGSLEFVFADDRAGARSIEAGGEQVIPPEVVHHVVVGDPVRFRIEFYR